MRKAFFAAALFLVTADAHAKGTKGEKEEKPWCAAEVSELSDHTCWFDGGTPSDGRRTLVVYMHGAYAATPGFQHLQQKALSIQAKQHHFTLLLPTAPRSAGGYLWPGTAEGQKDHEAAIIANIEDSKKELEKR